MITMIGIDHTKANIDQRSAFALTTDTIRKLIPDLKADLQAEGIVLLATCNRFEVWVDSQDMTGEDLLDGLCQRLQIKGQGIREIFAIKQEREAVEHLFFLACGMESAIFAEDQIISQVKKALDLSRELYCSDGVLEVLFRMAVTSAKRIKSEVHFSRANQTAIDGAIRMMLDRDLIGPDSRCMVIGNGEMGQISAMSLKKVCQNVKVTVRQYHSGEVKIPAGCERMDYGKRMDYFPSCHVVVSATASPHFTIRAEDIRNLPEGKKITLIDLAVPRDIDPTIREKFPDLLLFDIDDFKTTDGDRNLAEKEQAARIIGEEMGNFYEWMEGRDLIPRIRSIQDKSAEDLVWRMQQLIRKMEILPEQKDQINQQLEKTSAKVVGKLLYALRDELSGEEFLKCIQALESRL